MTKKYYFISVLFILCFQLAYADIPLSGKIKKVLKKEILKQAEWALLQQPVTVTASQCERSAGGVHDFFSEGDYWWPNPADLNGPYIQKDGLTNPENFTAHRKAMIRFSQVMGSLTSAYIITKEEKYVKHAMTHLKAWFIDTATFMNPSLLYAQAIKGKVTGRGVGIIDMIQMMEVAQGVRVMEKAKLINQNDLQKIKNWFADYLKWVTTHPYGIEERDAKNNHATCWVMQVAVFAKLVNNQQILDDCRNRFKTILLPNQMNKDGSFPLEIKRTKPYGYSLFNLDAMSTICHVLNNSKDNLWDFSLADNRSLKLAIDFLYPFVAKKKTWTYNPDVMYWNDWPVAQPFLLFGYYKYKNEKWLNTWKKMEHYPATEEVIRNLPVRNPLIWLED
ncbi:alginate lyase family protein [Ferruginibacter sp.]